MTNKEAIKRLTYDWHKTHEGQVCIDSDKADAFLEAVGVGIKAINSYPTAHIDRETWTAEWICDSEKDEQHCSNCHHVVCASDYLRCKLPPYCEMCGRAMTAEAWAMLEKRLKGVM